MSATDEFFLIGNAVQYASIPCLFAMGDTIAGERQPGDPAATARSPARRVPLFLGRALPVIVNGFVVSMFALIAGALVSRPDVPLGALVPIVARHRGVRLSPAPGSAWSRAALRCGSELAVLSNVVFGLLLIFTGSTSRSTTLPAGWRRSLLAPVDPRPRGGATGGRRGRRCRT